MKRKCEHQLTMKNSWLFGPKIVCQHCKKRWDVRGETQADAGSWVLVILVVGLSCFLFGEAVQAFASYGYLSGWVGYVLICLIVAPYMIVVKFGAFALGHWVHGQLIRRSGDLRRWIVEDPYHVDL